MVTSEHLICAASPFAMVRAQGRTQLCSSAPFDYGIESTMIFERLLALRVSSADVFSPRSIWGKSMGANLISRHGATLRWWRGCFR